MKFIATDLKATEYATGGMALSFDCGEKTKSELLNLKQGQYVIDVNPHNKARTDKQNRYLWKLIGEICVVENGSMADVDEIYLQLLEEAGAKIDYLEGIPESKKTLEEYFRIVKIRDERISNGTKTYVYMCYSGSSHFDTKQMSLLLDKTIERAEKDGINVENWIELLKE